MDALLKSCEDVLRRYVTDEVAMAGEEMPADRTAEAVYVQHPPPAFFLGFRTIFCGVVQKWIISLAESLKVIRFASSWPFLVSHQVVKCVPGYTTVSSEVAKRVKVLRFRVPSIVFFFFFFEWDPQT
jgi:hypothetical protein